jgi:hypothetical protein
MSYLPDSPDVLVPGLFVKSKVFVQTESNVVSVEAVREFPKVEKVLLEGASDR